jgi:hypothetical protein
VLFASPGFTTFFDIFAFKTTSFDGFHSFADLSSVLTALYHFVLVALFHCLVNSFPFFTSPASSVSDSKWESDVEASTAVHMATSSASDPSALDLHFLECLHDFFAPVTLANSFANFFEHFLEPPARLYERWMQVRLLDGGGIIV